jgi:large subunit ribosomal protein L1
MGKNLGVKKLGKRMKKVRALLEEDKLYPLEQACDLLCQTASAKFDETVECVFNLGVDPKKADQNLRGSVSLPHGLGKSVKVAVFAKGDKAREATEAGADFVGADDLVEQIKGGDFNFDSIIATPDMMIQVGKVGKILGPRGLMPSPKVGTVTFEVGAAVKSIKAGRAEYRVDKEGNLHTAVGKASFGSKKIFDNINAMVTAINKAKPSTSKGIYMKSMNLSLTMGPGVAVDVAPIRVG